MVISLFFRWDTVNDDSCVYVVHFVRMYKIVRGLNMLIFLFLFIYFCLCSFEFVGLHVFFFVWMLFSWLFLFVCLVIWLDVIVWVYVCAFSLILFAWYFLFVYLSVCVFVCFVYCINYIDIETLLAQVFFIIRTKLNYLISRTWKKAQVFCFSYILKRKLKSYQY